MPLTRGSHEPPTWAECKVNPDHHISFAMARYSVPTRYIPRRVRAGVALVRIYADGSLIKTHTRQESGGRATDYGDYPAELTPYALRDPRRIIRKATELHADIGRCMEQPRSGTLPYAVEKQLPAHFRVGRAR